MQSVSAVSISYDDNYYTTGPLTISKSLNQSTHGQWFVQWFLTRGITHFITDTQSSTERVREKEQTNKHGLGQLQAQERWGLYDTFRAAFRAFVDYRRRVFCAKFLQSHEEC